LLGGWGFPAEKLSAVEAVIRTHQPQDDPASFEATLVHDADILEQLGSMGALRALVKVGRDTRYPTFSSVLPVLGRAIEQLPGRLRLPAARELAAGRAAFLRSFLEAIEAEAGGLLY
jgi:uncharacterized protein